MFKNVFLFFAAMLFLFSWNQEVYAGGSSVDFSWIKADNPAWGTKIYIGTEPGIYVNSEDAGKNTDVYHLVNLQYSTKYYFTATHYLDGAESIKTEEISFTTKDQPETTFSPLEEIIEDIRSYNFILTIEPF